MFLRFLRFLMFLLFFLFSCFLMRQKARLMRDPYATLKPTLCEPYAKPYVKPYAKLCYARLCYTMQNYGMLYKAMSYTKEYDTTFYAALNPNTVYVPWLLLWISFMSQFSVTAMYSKTKSLEINRLLYAHTGIISHPLLIPKRPIAISTA